MLQEAASSSTLHARSENAESLPLAEHFMLPAYFQVAWDQVQSSFANARDANCGNRIEVQPREGLDAP